MDINTLYQYLKDLELDHSREKLSEIFGVTDDQIHKFSKSMAKISHEIREGNKGVSDIIQHIIDNMNIKAPEELIVFMFIGGMGYGHAEHHSKMDDMRADVLDMAIKMKDKMGEGFNPKDMIDKEALQRVINDSDGTDF